MVEAGININYVGCHFVFIKQLLTEQSIVSGKQGWLEIARNLRDKKKTKSTRGTFDSNHMKAGEISFSTPYLLTSGNCLW